MDNHTATMSKRDAQRGLLDYLDESGLTEYGSIIETCVIHQSLGIVQPAVAPKAVYDRLAMQELAAIDYCRGVLLLRGKYLQGTSSGYRVLLPSENKTQIDAYISSADRKLARALKLSRNTQVDTSNADQTEARIVMKQCAQRREYDQISKYI
jgi:hypothetical protein